jgi:2-C-methyl-D-erythritol 2,4-cyclodiphosphate synthase
MSSRAGTGYDLHRLVEGRRLVLGGVEIEEADRGLAGHSDADALTHAIIDALLGAAGLGDIGLHFPDTDERYRDASSMSLLTEVCALLEDQGWTIRHADATVICEWPRLSPHRDAMRRSLAEAMGLQPIEVNVKFTTSEGVGIMGRSEAIAVTAIATVERA